MDTTSAGRARARRYVAFLRGIIALHPTLFAASVAGASLFALCTVASSIAIRWVIDNQNSPCRRIPIIGMKTREQVLGNARACSRPVDGAAIARLEQEIKDA